MTVKLVAQLLGSDSDGGTGSIFAQRTLGMAILHSELEKLDDFSDTPIPIHQQA